MVYTTKRTQVNQNWRRLSLSIALGVEWNLLDVTVYYQLTIES